MSEKHIPRLEQEKQHDTTKDHEHHERIHTAKAEAAERARLEKSAENLAHIKELAKKEAQEAHKTKQEEPEEADTDSLLGMQHTLKSTAYTRTLSRIQQKLSKPDRTFSRAVHSPLIDKVSTVCNHTVARPSGLLGGSISAFFGSVVILYFSKQYGFRYNYLILFLLFIGGFLAGAIIELLVWAAYSRRKQRYE